METDGRPSGHEPQSDRSARRLRVLTLVNRFGPNGGAEGLALTIATHLDPERFESTLCVSRWPPPSPPDRATLEAMDELSARGVALLGLGRRRKIDVWVWWRLARFLRSSPIDVLHAHMFGSNLWGTLLGRAAGVPVIVAHEHTWSYEGQLLRRLLDRYVIARGADRFVAVSRADQRRMIAVERIPEERTVFIPNGLARGRARPASTNDVRAELGIGPDVPLIGAVGWLRPQKAHHVLIRAAALLADQHPEAQVVIVGRGPEHATLQALIQELNVGEKVKLIGMRTDVPDVLHALDVAVLCSDFEGTPIAVLEYMAAGLPVVATAVGGVPDLIEDGTHGLLVPPGDPAALAGAISKLLEDRARAREMGEKGRDRQRSEFEIDEMIHKIEGLYLELLSRRGRLTAPV